MPSTRKTTCRRLPMAASSRTKAKRLASVNRVEWCLFFPSNPFFSNKSALLNRVPRLPSDVKNEAGDPQGQQGISQG